MIISVIIMSFFLTKNKSLNSFLINPGKTFPSAFEGFFFNEAEFVSKIPSEEKYTFIDLDNRQEVKARFVLFINGSEGVSPLRASFGSFEFAKNYSSLELKNFVAHIESFAKEKKLSGLSITSWPDCYAPEQAMLLKSTLLDSGFQILIEDHNYHLETGTPFESLIHVSERGKLNKCIKAGFKFSTGTLDDIKKIHELVSEARKQRGHPLSMSFDDYLQMFERFPGRYVLFKLTDGDKLIAACTGVKINSKILYNFLGADDVAYKGYSPMVMLMKGAYDYCLDHGYEIFDLGIGTASGVPNPGLIQFKKYIGGEFSSKFTYRKSY
jgi:hypothetical protein